MDWRLGRGQGQGVKRRVRVGGGGGGGKYIEEVISCITYWSVKKLNIVITLISWLRLHFLSNEIPQNTRAINWLYLVNMLISMINTKVSWYGNHILALQPCGGNPYGA